MDNIDILRHYIVKQDGGGIPIRDALLALDMVEKELKVSSEIIESRGKVLQAIPACEAHGEFCIPHAIEWIKSRGEVRVPEKRMLFVDDRTKRIHHALTNFPDYAVTIAPNVPEALRQMCMSDWDVISLDHDLMGHDFEDPDTPTCGMEIVRYIAKTGGPTGRKIPEFWIHSSNLFAAHLMIVEFGKLGLHAYYKPITYQVEHMTYDEKGHPK